MASVPVLSGKLCIKTANKIRNDAEKKNAV